MAVMGAELADQPVVTVMECRRFSSRGSNWMGQLWGPEMIHLTGSMRNAVTISCASCHSHGLNSKMCIRSLAMYTFVTDRYLHTNHSQNCQGVLCYSFSNVGFLLCIPDSRAALTSLVCVAAAFHTCVYFKPVFRR